jgi:hypothetical protein
MLHLDLIQMASIAGKVEVANDDRLGCGDRHAWVIDGATDLGEPGLLGSRGGAAWLAATADRAFTQASGPLEAICDSVFELVEAAYHREKQRDPHALWEIPSAAFAVVSLEGDVLRCAYASDCPVLHRRGNAVSFVTPEPDRRREQAAALALGAGRRQAACARPRCWRTGARRATARSGACWGSTRRSRERRPAIARCRCARVTNCC